ncbi:MAG: phosphoribosylamine--glycine ligase, partial [Bacteroidetes bacterium]|nr:phosphoribosylamine--glycine ligase [Bacteroidota bacterium]
MNILIIGSGGREHALAWKIKQSPRCEALYIAPGNAGTAQVGANVSINVADFSAVEAF